jgi:hypothetical protein
MSKLTTAERTKQVPIDEARAKAEIAIERILLNLTSETGLKLDTVEVDTRNFANCNVEIFFQGNHA